MKITLEGHIPQPYRRFGIWPFQIRCQEPPAITVVRRLFTAAECKQIIELSNIEQADLEIDRFYRKSTRSFRQGYIDVWDEPWIAKRIEAAVVKANRRYGFALSGLSTALNVLEYRRGDHTARHRDTAPTKLTVTVALTTGYKGGELLIEAANVPRLRVGDAIIMPGYASHEIKPVISGRRLVLVSWVIGGRFL